MESPSWDMERLQKQSPLSPFVDAAFEGVATVGSSWTSAFGLDSSRRYSWRCGACLGHPTPNYPKHPKIVCGGLLGLLDVNERDAEAKTIADWLAANGAGGRKRPAQNEPRRPHFEYVGPTHPRAKEAYSELDLHAEALAIHNRRPG